LAGTSESSRRLKVVIADDSQAMRDRVSRLFAGEMDVVATVSDGESVVKAVQDLRPNLVILDIAMPIQNGMSAARKIRDMGISVPIVFLSVQSDHEFREAAVQLGASYVSKARMRSDLGVAVRDALTGRIFVSKP
jgi:DNA-binding NarL/FixJ family response regulator